MYIVAIHLQISQLCAFKEWPAAIVTDPRLDKSHLALCLVSEDADMWKLGAEGYILQCDLVNSIIVQRLDTHLFSSEVLRFSENGDVFLTYRKQPAEFLLYGSDDLVPLHAITLPDCCPFLDLPFRMPPKVNYLEQSGMLKNIPAAKLAMRSCAIQGLKLKPEACALVIPLLSSGRRALSRDNCPQWTCITYPTWPKYSPLSESMNPSPRFQRHASCLSRGSRRMLKATTLNVMMKIVQVLCM